MKGSQGRSGLDRKTSGLEARAQVHHYRQWKALQKAIGLSVILASVVWAALQNCPLIHRRRHSFTLALSSRGPARVPSCSSRRSRQWIVSVAKWSERHVCVYLCHFCTVFLGMRGGSDSALSTIYSDSATHTLPPPRFLLPPALLPTQPPPSLHPFTRTSAPPA